MDRPKFRWGIMGAAQIARKNWKAIYNSGNGVVAAVASRSIDRSAQFIKECQTAAPFIEPPKALGSYEELLAHPGIDGVYIPLPTGIRKDWVVRAAKAGKHVVCEKPCGANAAEVAEMIEACRQHKVQFMDGVMFVHSRRLERIREVLGSVGQIRRIESAFSFHAPDEFYTANIRADAELEPLGCLGDLGWYCIRFALWTLNWQLPHKVTGRSLSQTRRGENRSAVPTESSAELLFPSGVSSGFYCSFRTELQQWAHISGAKGSLDVRDFVLPYFGSELSFQTQSPVFRVNGCEFNMEPHIQIHSIDEYSNGHPTSQETNLFRNFVAQVQSGTVNDLWPEAALKTQRVMNACLESSIQDGAPVLLQ